jgi:polysaccharide pyruvyl transferase CsaB
MTRLLISGFYGMGNAGDEAVLAAIVQLVREREPGIAIRVLSGDPPGTAQSYGVDGVPRMQPAAVIAAMRGCDLFISGGGSLLQDITSAHSPLYYLGLLLLARAARRPAVVLAQGIGPLRRPALRRLTGRVLDGVARITVRDPESAAELSAMGVRRPPIEVTADPVFALAPAPEERGQELLSSGLAAGPSGSDQPRWIGISLRPWPGIDTAIHELAVALELAVSQEAARAVRPVLLPLQPHEDAPVCRRLADALGGAPIVEASPTPSEWLALTGCLDLVIAVRLHALIFAATMGASFLGVSYDPKVDSLLARLGRAPAGHVGCLDAGALSERIVAALADPSTERAPVEVIDGLRAAARRNAEVVFESVGSRV